jgi:hypothetical protein
MERTPATNTHLRYDEDGSAVSAADFFQSNPVSNEVTSDLAGLAENLNRTRLGPTTSSNDSDGATLSDVLNLLQQFGIAIKDLQRESRERNIYLSPAPNTTRRDALFSSPPIAQHNTQSLELQVPRAEFQKTNGFNVDLLKKLNIGILTTDAPERLKSISRIFDSEGLLSLAKGIRKRPITSSANPHGYSPTAVIYNEATNEHLSHRQDDLHHYEHDSKRLQTLLLIVFDKSIHHLDPEAFRLLNNSRIYASIMDYYHGQQTKDAHRCQADMTNFKISPSTNSFRQDFYKFSDLLDKLKHASKKEISDEDLHEYLVSKFLSDSRMGVKEALLAGRIAKSSYSDLVASMIATTESVTPAKTAKINSVSAKADQDTEKPKGVCYNFQKGSCTRNNCPYSHVPKDKVVNRPAPEKGNKSSFQPLSKEHRKKIGEGKGRYHKDTNPDSFSKLQVLQIKVLQAQAALINSSPAKEADPWITQHMAFFDIENPSSDSQVMNMMKSSFSMESAFTEDRTSDDMPTPVFVRERTNTVQLPDETTVIYVLFKNYNMKSLSMRGNIKAKPLWIFTERAQDFHRIKQWAIPNLPLITFFGWANSVPITNHLAQFREDFRRGDQELMEVIYIINKTWLGATVEIMKFAHKDLGCKYMTFAPGSTYVRQGDPGSYISVFSTVNDFFDIFQLIQEDTAKLLGEQYQDFLIIALIFDFMAWSSVELRRRYSGVSDIDLMTATRDLLSMDVNIIAGQLDTEETTAFSFLLHAVIASVDFAPSVPISTSTPVLPSDMGTELAAELVREHPQLARLRSGMSQLERDRSLYERHSTSDGQKDGTRADLPATPLVKKRRAEENPETAEHISDADTPLKPSWNSRQFYQSPPISSRFGDSDFEICNPTTPTGLRSCSNQESPKFQRGILELCANSSAVPIIFSASASAISADPENILPCEITPLDAVSPHGGFTENLKTFHVQRTASINVVKRGSQQIMDSGASMSGTGDITMLKNVRNFEGMTVLPAFGEPIRTHQAGELGAFKLPTLLIKEMKDQTIVSVSQLMKQGHISIFTSNDFRVYTTKSAMKLLNILSTQGDEVARGHVHDGLYVIDNM